MTLAEEDYEELREILKENGIDVEDIKDVFNKKPKTEEEKKKEQESQIKNKTLQYMKDSNFRKWVLIEQVKISEEEVVDYAKTMTEKELRNNLFEKMEKGKKESLVGRELTNEEREKIKHIVQDKVQELLNTKDFEKLTPQEREKIKTVFGKDPLEIYKKYKEDKHGAKANKLEKEQAKITIGIELMESIEKKVKHISGSKLEGIVPKSFIYGNSWYILEMKEQFIVYISDDILEKEKQEIIKEIDKKRTGEISQEKLESIDKAVQTLNRVNEKNKGEREIISEESMENVTDKVTGKDKRDVLQEMKKILFESQKSNDERGK